MYNGRGLRRWLLRFMLLRVDFLAVGHGFSRFVSDISIRFSVRSEHETRTWRHIGLQWAMTTVLQNIQRIILMSYLKITRWRQVLIGSFILSTWSRSLPPRRNWILTAVVFPYVWSVGQGCQIAWMERMQEAQIGYRCKGFFNMSIGRIGSQLTASDRHMFSNLIIILLKMMYDVSASSFSEHLLNAQELSLLFNGDIMNSVWIRLYKIKCYKFEYSQLLILNVYSPNIVWIVHLIMKFTAPLQLPLLINPYPCLVSITISPSSLDNKARRFSRGS